MDGALMLSGHTLEGFFDEFEKIALTFQDIAVKHRLPSLASAVKGNVQVVPWAQSQAAKKVGQIAARTGQAVTAAHPPVPIRTAA
jgi:hypothetical protein